MKVVHEDEHIIVVEKPKGVLCVPGKEDNPSLSQAVFEAYGSEKLSADKMVVHRLGMDTSGLVVFARSIEALRAMNTAFRTRKVSLGPYFKDLFLNLQFIYFSTGGT